MYQRHGLARGLTDPVDIGLRQGMIAEDGQLHVGKMLADILEDSLPLDAEPPDRNLAGATQRLQSGFGHGRSEKIASLKLETALKARRMPSAASMAQLADAYDRTILSYLAGRKCS